MISAIRIIMMRKRRKERDAAADGVPHGPFLFRRDLRKRQDRPNHRVHRFGDLPEQAEIMLSFPAVMSVTTILPTIIHMRKESV